ncbi:hypothetical protein PF008_g18550 [Phytophthora fragariae]|uniref:Tf2-1-like SH3-like domain-containing protein n=1 Tax=Phytophthora fragariae TaxID=53985 RepID=A0A6G0R5C2_9STRA|nr:hypothetical protein PF008_g18550 [Phytophthora fragariae]
MRHPRVPSVLGAVAPSLSGGGYPVSTKPNEHADTSNISAVSTRARTARSPIDESTMFTPGVDTLNNRNHTQAGPVVNKSNGLNKEFNSQVMDFVQRRQAVIRFVQDAIADISGRGNTNEFKVGSLVLLATQNLARHAVSDFGASKLAPRFVGPFTGLAKHGNAYTLDIPSSMRFHPTFYVGRLKPYSQHESPTPGDSARSSPRARRRVAPREKRSTPGRPGCSKRSARPDQFGPSKASAPASSLRAQSSGGVPQPPNVPRPRPATVRGVFPPPPPPLRDARGELAGLFSESLIIRSGPKVGFIFVFVG